VISIGGVPGVMARLGRVKSRSVAFSRVQLRLVAYEDGVHPVMYIYIVLDLRLFTFFFFLSVHSLEGTLYIFDAG
jgi:hypothetical protein